MKKRSFDLSDFDSRACDITVRTDENSVLTLSLRKFTLKDRIEVGREWGSVEKWEKTLFPQDENFNEAEWLECLLKTVFMLEETGEFKDWEELAETLDCTPEVLAGLQKAILYVLNGSEPLLDKYDEEVKKSLNKMQNRKTRRQKKKAPAKSGPS